MVLAILNDLTQIPVAGDLQVASKTPEQRSGSVLHLVLMSTLMGFLEVVLTIPAGIQIATRVSLIFSLLAVGHAPGVRDLGFLRKHGLVRSW